MRKRRIDPIYPNRSFQWQQTAGPACKPSTYIFLCEFQQILWSYTIKLKTKPGFVEGLQSLSVFARFTCEREFSAICGG